jgi:hypothetical protein
MPFGQSPERNNNDISGKKVIRITDSIRIIRNGNVAE